MFENCKFIKAETDNKNTSYSPLFRKRFIIDRKLNNPKIMVCGLGIAYYYLNGVLITEDKFTAPVSNYNKTLWYNEYDISAVLKFGENVLAVECGNGFFNEGIISCWEVHLANWRDTPQFILKIYDDEGEILVTDSTWKCNNNGPTTYNELRSGENFDFRIYDDNWVNYRFDDSKWNNATEVERQPLGVFRKCNCEPIREIEEIQPSLVIQNGKKYVVDFGKNISGYVKFKFTGKCNGEIVINYGEDIENNELKYCHTKGMPFYDDDIPFQENKIFCIGKECRWYPKFSYYGFRYVEIKGIDNIDDVSMVAAFVHQDVKRKTYFKCSNEYLNKLFLCGVNSTYSNMQYQLTDCPTREKLGWINDAQMSLEQILTNFESVRFLEKWMQDLCDSIRDDGAIPSIIPTSGWGYDKYCGFVLDGLLFELPYRLYIHTGKKQYLCNFISYFERYFKYIEKKCGDDSLLDIGLADWGNPISYEAVPRKFINAILMYKSYCITDLALELNGIFTNRYKKKIKNIKNLILSKYINKEGKCMIEHQTAVSMLIYFDLGDFQILKEQLKSLVEKKSYCHECGMVGLRFLYMALNKCELYEYSYKIITQKNSPSYNDWMNNGATTLWEYFGNQDERYSLSKNHHMFSDFMSWITKTIIGINMSDEYKYTGKITVNPIYFEDLNYVEGRYLTEHGEIKIGWERINVNIYLKIIVPKGEKVYYKGNLLNVGINEFVI